MQIFILNSCQMYSILVYEDDYSGILWFLVGFMSMMTVQRRSLVVINVQLVDSTVSRGSLGTQEVTGHLPITSGFSETTSCSGNDRNNESTSVFREKMIIL